MTSKNNLVTRNSHWVKARKEDSGSKILYDQQDEKESIELSKPEVLKAEGGGSSPIMKVSRDVPSI